MEWTPRTKHVIVISYGDLPRRVEFCPMWGCQLDSLGVTDCGVLACQHCGASPMFLYRREDGAQEAVCQVCTHKRVVA